MKLQSVETYIFGKHLFVFRAHIYAQITNGFHLDVTSPILIGNFPSNFTCDSFIVYYTGNYFIVEHNNKCLISVTEVMENLGSPGERHQGG